MTFRLPGEGFASWPTDCSADYPLGSPNQYVHCWAADVDDLNVTFGPGNDTGADTITGTAAADNLDGYWAADTIKGGAGNDRIDGKPDDDVLFGGDGDDTVYGGEGSDQVTGNRGADNPFGDYTGCCLNNGNDKIFSADGIADAINCGGGADALEADRLDIIGGDGNQLCESMVVSNTPAPNTTITKHPRNQTFNGVAKFAFKSSEPGSRFKCKVDGKPWKTCTSPYQVGVRPGRHTFRVRAVDAAGNVDPTPAVWRWRVMPRR